MKQKYIFETSPTNLYFLNKQLKINSLFVENFCCNFKRVIVILRAVAFILKKIYWILMGQNISFTIFVRYLLNIYLM